MIIYIWLYIYMIIYMIVYIWLYMYMIIIYIWLYIWLYIYDYIYIWLYIWIYIWLYIWLYIYVEYVYIYINTHCQHIFLHNQLESTVGLDEVICAKLWWDPVDDGTAILHRDDSGRGVFRGLDMSREWTTHWGWLSNWHVKDSAMHFSYIVPVVKYWRYSLAISLSWFAGKSHLVGG